MLQHTYEIPNASLIATRNIQTQKLYLGMHQKFGRKIHIYRYYQFVNTLTGLFGKNIKEMSPLFNINALLTTP